MHTRWGWDRVNRSADNGALCREVRLRARRRVAQPGPSVNNPLGDHIQPCL